MSRPQSIAEVASRRAADLNVPFWKPMCEFLDEFYEDRPDRVQMLAEEPWALAKEESAYLAASAEYLCEVYELPCPDWASRPIYFLAAAWWPWGSGEAVRALFVAESPEAFRRRNIFIERRPLRRKAGPKPPGGYDEWWKP